MQADELPKGAHQFRVVAYDPTGKQLAELPQTVQGRSKDASTAGSNAIAAQRANHMAVDTLVLANTVTQQQLSQVAASNSDLHDDVTQLISTVNDLRLSNEDMLLKRLEFEDKMAHKAKVFEAIEGAIGQLLVPIGTLVIQKYGPQLLGMTVEDLQKLAPPVPKPADPEPPAESPTNVGTVAPTEEPVDSIVPVVPESGQGTLPPNTQGGSQRNNRLLPRKRGPKAPTTKTTKRK
jgi:hypothetical protein